MDVRSNSAPAGRHELPLRPLARSPAARNLPALVMPPPQRPEQAWGEAAALHGGGGRSTPTTPTQPYSPHAMAMRALGARTPRSQSPRPATPRPVTPLGATYVPGGEAGIPRMQLLYPPHSRPGAAADISDDELSSDDDEVIRDRSVPGSPARQGAKFELGAPRRTQSPAGGLRTFTLVPRRLQGSTDSVASHASYVPSQSGSLPQFTEVAAAAPSPTVTTDSAQVQLLRAPNVSLLGPNLRRRSWLAPALLATMVLSKLPLMYGVLLSTEGFADGDAVKKGCGVAAVAVSFAAYLGATGIGLYDVYKVRPGIERDPRLRFLGGRYETMALGAFGLCSPAVLCGAEYLYATAFRQHDTTKMNWALLPAIVGSAGWIVVCTRLFTFMQLRRGWAPVLQHPKVVEPITDLALTAMLIFGATAGEKGFSRTSRQLSVIVPGLAAILGTALGKSLLTYTALQNCLSDDTHLPWEVASEWL